MIRIIFISLLCLQAYPDCHAEIDNEPKVIERVIQIEGQVEKPRIIFIIPRAKLWKDDIPKKNYIADILKPVYPELLIRDIEKR